MKKEVTQKVLLLAGIYMLIDAIFYTIKVPQDYSYILKFTQAFSLLISATELIKNKIIWALVVLIWVITIILYVFLHYIN